MKRDSIMFFLELFENHVFQIFTWIAGYCASSTECSDYCLENTKKIKIVWLFLLCVTKRSQCNKKLSKFDNQSTKANWTTVFVESKTILKHQKFFKIFFFKIFCRKVLNFGLPKR